MDPRRPWIRRNGDHSALGGEIQDRALDDTGVVDVGEHGDRQRRVEIREVIGRRHAARAFAGVAETAATKGLWIDEKAEPIPERLPGTTRHGAPDGMTPAHRLAERGRGSAQQPVQEQRGFRRRTKETPVIDPARMIAPGVTPCGGREVIRLPRETDARNAEWRQYEVPQRVFQVFAGGLFDQAADIEIADVRVRPALIRSKEQLVRVDAPYQLLLAPRRVVAR